MFKKLKSPKNRLNAPKFLVLVAIVALVVAVGGVVGLRVWYNSNLQPVSSNTATSYFTVESGQSRNQIATNLQKANLIRSAKAFETYLRSNEITILQAGTYTLSPSMSVKTIVHKMSTGDVTQNLLTILPGKRLDQIKAAFEKSGYSQSEVDQAFNPASYTDEPMLKYLPASASLEGFLYPDSFQKDANTPASAIVRESLDEMQQHLTPALINSFAAHGLSVYQGVTLASIVYQETGDPTYEPTVAQVFLSRLQQGMMLQSNVTANYAADVAGVPRSVNINSPYNTYQVNGLPPGPISNVTNFALNATANPSNSNYLYFIAGDNGKLYFANTPEQHNANIKQYCQQKCAQP